MKTKLLSIFFLLFIFNYSFSQNPVTSTDPNWDVKYLYSPTGNPILANPYEVTVGPDGWLWITERAGEDQGSWQQGERIVRVNPIVGSNISGDEYEYTERDELINLSSAVNQTVGQDGLMGMAIHPDLYDDITTTSNNYVYVAFTYSDSGQKLRIARLVYNHNGGTNPSLTIDNTLTNGAIIDGIEAGSDHNSGRLKIGPDLKLYYTIGDNGANQFSNACNEIRSQHYPDNSNPYTQNNYEFYKGKVLRINLDGSVPSDNPTFGVDNVRSHIYSIGHRNPQGLVFDNNGTLFSSEHGPKTDDEINIIESGMNYGWPNVAGFDDGEYYEYCNWSTAPGCNVGGWNNTDHSCLAGSVVIQENAPTDFKPPIGTIGSTMTDAVDNNYDFTSGWLTWPTVAPSSIAIYEEGNWPSAAIPDWNNSLLVTTLKEGTIFRAKLNATRDDIVGDNHLADKVGYEEFHSSEDRYRDVVIDPSDGLTIYAILDSSGTTSGPSGTGSVGIDHHGAIVKISFNSAQTVLSTPEVADAVKFNVYPNPASDVLNLSNPDRVDYNYNISNLVGQTVLLGKVSASEHTGRVDTSHLNSGVYIISVTSDKGSVSKKLIIE